MRQASRLSIEHCNCANRLCSASSASLAESNLSSFDSDKDICLSAN